jgi:molybdopterin-guanine dinucleotide biosynthesis protein
MNATVIEELKSKVNILELLKHLGNKVYKNGVGWKGNCPFHADGTDDFMVINEKEKTAECQWCKRSWDMISYVKELKKVDENKAIEIIKEYYEQNKPAPKYEIKEESRYEIVILIQDREYMLTGFNLKRLNDFSLTLKLIYKGKVTIDKVNLSRSKSRYDFISEAKDILLLSEETLKEDLFILMEIIEGFQRENIKKMEEKQPQKKIFIPDEREVKQVMNLLSNKNVLTDMLLPDLEKMGYEGMEDVKQILYLAATSRMLDRPISVLQVGNSASGKSLGQDMVLHLMPDDEYEYYTCLSPTALSYYGKYDLKHKILCVDEFQGFGESSYPLLRSFISKGMTSKAYTAVNKITSEMQTEQREVHGPIAFITSTTHDGDLDNETRSRMLQIPMDESAESTERIHMAMARRNTKGGLSINEEKEKIARKHKTIQKTFNKVEMIIPDDWIEKMTFNSKRLVYRRKYQGYLSMLGSYVLLSQHQRKVYTEKDSQGKYKNYSELLKEDIHFINKLVEKTFRWTMDDLSPVNRDLLMKIVMFCKERAKETSLKYYEVAFTRREIREYLGWDLLPVRRSFEKLLGLEYIYHTYGGGNGRHYYKVNVEDDNEDFISPPSLRLWYPK